MRKEMVSVLRRTLVSCATQVRQAVYQPELDEDPKYLKDVLEHLTAAVLGVEQIEKQKGKVVHHGT